MSRYVVDNSIAVKWFVPEVHSEFAIRLLGPAHQMTAPDLLPAEFANALWKKVRERTITLAEAVALLPELERQPIALQPGQELLASAFELAVSHNRTVYDSLYVALALRERCQLVTADRKLFNALANPLGATLLWVEDIPEA